MTRSAAYQKLLNKRDNAIRAIRFHAEKVDAITNDDQIEALSRLQAIENSYEKFMVVCESIENEDEFAYSDFTVPTEDIVDIYIKTSSKLKTISKELLNSSLLNSTPIRPARPTVEVKLPQISIPTFSGDYKEWTAFYDAFMSLVDNQIGLSDHNKMHYLVNALRGPALKAIGQLLVTDANYKIALKTLIGRFKNKRAIVNACLKRFISQSPMKFGNAEEIRTMIDETKETISGIENAEVHCDEWGPFVVYIVQTKMDFKTLTAWENHLGGSTDLPRFNTLITFLETQFRIMDNSNDNSCVINYNASSFTNSNNNRSNQNSNQSNNKSISKGNTVEECAVCSESHWTLHCQKFIDWTPMQRKQFALDKNLCLVCLNKHQNGQCKSKYRCKKCQGTHSSSLHTVYDDLPGSSTAESLQIATIQESEKLFATALVKVKDKFGAYHLLRAFVDMGSGGALISERAAQLLCLPRNRENTPLTSIDDISLGKSTNSVQIQVKSNVEESFELHLKSHVLKKIIAPKKFPEKLASDWKHLNELELADQNYLNPSHIDLLFGVDIYSMIIKDGIKRGAINEPVAQNSHLGWLIFGSTSDTNSLGFQVNSISLSDELQKFWRNEEILVEPVMTEEHSKCVAHFKKTHTRLSDGSFMVSLPFEIDPESPNFLGDSRKMALCRWFQVEKRFKRDPLYKQRYHEEINNYLERNHMSLCTSSNDEGYFLPHHAIVRENRTTTKQRTVYDASAKTTNGFSLNDRCLSGPTIQPELVNIFTRWRTYKIALSADIEKMYRMIKICPEHRKFQKILWRFSEHEQIKTYELNTVTFGTKPAPYLAIATTFALADAEKEKFPEAAERLKTDFYVDDCMSGSHSVESAIKLQKDFDALLKSGQFLLRKWASNEPMVVQNIPPENRAIKTSFEINMDESIKTLGLVWTPSVDELSFTIEMTSFHKNKSITKRQLLSDASKIFDPCGFLSPITIKAKITMQEVWKSGTDWDCVVPSAIQSEWNAYKNELPLIHQIKIKRWFSTNLESKISLHGFCDSSEKAMACAIYIVQTTNGQTTSILVCSKTKVAPIATQTIPRLELNGAVLLAKLMDRNSRNLKIPKESVYLWTDSSIVLAWLQQHASRWMPYVAARVRTIHELFDKSHWNHVRTHENPADIASRGAFPSELLDNHLWFHGPKWLVCNETEWPKLSITPPSQENLEAKPTIAIQAIQFNADIHESEILTQFSSFHLLSRITALMFRFINQCKKKETLKCKKAFITVDELDRAEMFWVKYTQQLHFKNEISSIKLNKNVSEKSPLKQLNPQFDKNGILIVYGRLQYANFSHLRKFPMILPAKSQFSKLIIEKAHLRSIHGSIHLTLATVRQEYWILNARNMVKTHIHKCIVCYRQKPKPLTQLMAPLPEIKTQAILPFIHTGIDFAGPFDIKISTRRNASTAKGYVCVFVCMVSKAVHLEAVGDLSTQKFVMALRRFVSRRGMCTDLYCDQGTNFKGASNELPLLLLQAEAETSIQIQNLFAKDKIKFNFNPPSAPHWGGQWESYVKLTKHHLNRVSASVMLTFEDISTLFAQIEACINSRPLCAITSDPNDLDPITAGHLLTGRALNLIPEPSLLQLKDTTLDQFQAIQKGMQIFWKRFYIEYLHTMHPRKKWYKEGEKLSVNDLVVIIDDNVPPAKWLLGRVVELHHGNDGFIRMATIQTKTKDDNYGKSNMSTMKKPSMLQRPIAKLCKLPIANALPPPTVVEGGEDVPNLHSEQ